MAYVGRVKILWININAHAINAFILSLRATEESVVISL